MKTKTLILVFLAFTVIGCQKSTQESTQKSAWKEFSSSAGGFSILLPGTPDENTSVSKTPDGPVNFHFFSLEYLDSWYGVQYSDYPQSYLQKVTPDELLNDACGACAMGMEATLLGESEISLHGHPGRELTLRHGSGAFVIKARLFLVGNRVYQLTVRTPPDKSNLENVLKFLNSFTLLEK